MASTPKPSSTSPSEPSLARSLLSLAIFIHFFCVLVVLSSNFRRSALQNQLVRIFGPYTQLLDLDPDFTPYYYTFGRPMDDDAILVVDLYPENIPIADQKLLKTVTLPDGGSRWLGNRARYLALARVVAQNADPEFERDEITGEIARAVAHRLMLEQGAKRAVVRCVQRMSQPLDPSGIRAGFPRDNPAASQYDVTVYEADVYFDEDNQPQVLKRASRAEVAPRQTTPRPGVNQP